MSDPEYDRLREELHQRVDSLYAEHGDDVTREDIEEMINDVFHGL